MPYHLNATRVLYQTSKYAPVAVIQLDITTPTGESAGLNKAQINSGLYQVSAGSTGGPLSLSREDSPAEMYCDLVLELQRYAGHSVEYSRAQDSEPNHGHRVFIEYEEQTTALYAGELATELLNAIIKNGDSPGAGAIEALQQSLDEYVKYALVRSLDPNTRLFMQAAKRQDIPLLRLDQPPFEQSTPEAVLPNGLLQLGWGNQQRLCKGPLPGEFASLENLQQVSDRAQLLPRLKKAAIPLPGQDLEFISRNQVKRAQRSARRIGYPVTLRPRMNTPFPYLFPDNHVFGPLHNDAQVELVANYFREQVGADVWVESHVTGKHYRFLVLNAAVLSVVCCAPPTIIGDGLHSIAELALQQAATATNAVSHQTWHALAQGDSGMVCRLQLAGQSLNSIPGSGDRIALRGFGTLYNGGTFEDMTKTVPARFNVLAIEAAKQPGLEHLAGVDLTIGDLSGPAMMPNCAVTNIAPDPDLQVHAQLSEEGTHYIGDKYLALLFPKNRPSRIPTIAVTGTNGKTTTCRMVARILRAAGRKVGLACSDGVYLDNELLMAGDLAGVEGAVDVLTNQQVEAAVLETARGAMANTGIAFDHCDVGACLNVAEDHLGNEGIETLDQMAVHKRQVIERTTGVAVLNAEDPRCLAMQEHTAAREVILIAHSGNQPVIKAHCQAGGRAIVTIPREAGSGIGIMDSSGITPLLDVNQIPATMDGKALFNVENAMAAIAVSVGLGISDEVIIKGMSDFRMTNDNTPGRLNIYEGLPFRVIVDHAHNAHGLKAFCEFVNQLDVKGRRIAVLFGIGDRSDEEIRNNVHIVADNFDYFLCRDPRKLRGRSKGEIAALLTSTLIEHGIEKNSIETIINHEEAVDRALSIAKPSDLLVILLGNSYWDKIKSYSEKQLEEPNRQ